MKKRLSAFFAISFLVLAIVCTQTPAQASSAVPESKPGQDAPRKTADGFPDRQITLMVGYEPGGSTDGIIRTIAPFLSEELGVSVIVENVPGASNLLQLNTLYARRADGYNLGMGGTADGPWAYEITSVNPLPWKGDSFAILGRPTEMPASMGVIALKDRWPSFREFVEEVRSAEPGSINFGIQGPGRVDELMGFELEEVLGVDMNVVFYPSSNSIQTDLLTGDLDIGLIVANRMGWDDNPSFKVLMLMGDYVPDDYVVHLPLISDFYDILGGWKFDQAKYMNIAGGIYILAHGQVPQDRIEVLRGAMDRVGTNPEFQEKIKNASWPSYVNSEIALQKQHQVQEALIKAKSLQTETK